MTDIATEFGLVPSGINFKHPERFQPVIVGVAISSGNVKTSTLSDPGLAQFWTNLTANGISVDTNFSAGVPKQVLSAVGKGEVLGVVGPTAGGAETTQFTFVIDGATYISPAYSLASGQRAALWFAVLLADAFTTANAGAAGFAAIDSTKVILTDVAGNSPQFPGWASPITRNTPKLQFDSSCVISITHSANVTATASQQRQSGVGYRMLSTYT